MNPRIQNWRHRLPLTFKMVSATVIIGLLVWAVLDYFEVRRVKHIFLTQMTERLGRQAEEDRLRFDRYVKTMHQAVRMFLRLKNFNEYVKQQEWSSEDRIEIRYHRQPPSWFPERSMQRIFAKPRFALLIDQNRRVREIYQRQKDAPPPSLLNLSGLLLAKSYRQSYMTDIDNIPYLITSESLSDSTGQLLAILMLASPIDDEFLTASLGVSSYDHIVALLTSGEDPKILTSTNLEKVAAGLPIETVREKYFITGKAFFDYGASDLEISLISLISTAEVNFLTKSLVRKEQFRHAVSALIFILSFTAIMLWITRRIRLLTQSISDFSEETLGIKQEDIGKGDKLHILEERFKHLTEEVVEARDIIKRETEEKTRLIVENTFDAIITMDSDGLITTWNPQAETTFGWSSKEIIGKKVSETIIPSAYRKAHNKGLEKFLSSGESSMLNRQVEIEALHHDGYKFPVDLTISPVLSENKYIFIAVMRDITERKITQDLIQASLDEKEVLLREIHHRVKNNMQVITSLLRLQSGKITDQNTIEMLKESQNRIRSMALIHEKLYKSGDLAHINFKDYINNLTRGLYRSHGINTEMVALKIDAGDIMLGVDSAIPCGLIINELVSNALKHGFPDSKKGKIDINIHKTAEEEIEMTVRDNGIGMPEGLDFRKTGSMGLKLVTTLSENQLNGKIMLKKSEGTEFRIVFKELKRKESI